MAYRSIPVQITAANIWVSKTVKHLITTEQVKKTTKMLIYDIKLIAFIHLIKVLESKKYAAHTNYEYV